MSLFFAFFLILLLSILVISDAADGGDAFSYIDDAPDGPKNWGHLNTKWEECERGKLQSPINIDVENLQVTSSLGKLKRAYKPAPAKIYNRGHDIVVEWQRDAGKLEINGTSYKLVQCHWHIPSEHTINEKRYEMELHMVHSDGEGRKAVVAILYRFGDPDRFLTSLKDEIKKVDESGMELGIISPRSIGYGSKKYFRYIGSLTTPPCTENVIWTIADKVRTVSPEQIALYKDVLHHGFQDNARPIQASEERPVWLYSP